MVDKVDILAMKWARHHLLEAEMKLEDARLHEMAFEIGLKADTVGEYLDEALDDGGMTDG